MNIFLSWILGAIVTLLVPVANYFVTINSCLGAACAQAEFVFFLFPVFLLHSSLAIALYQLPTRDGFYILLGTQSDHNWVDGYDTGAALWNLSLTKCYM